MKQWTERVRTLHLRHKRTKRRVPLSVRLLDGVWHKYETTVDERLTTESRANQLITVFGSRATAAQENKYCSRKPRNPSDAMRGGEISESGNVAETGRGHGKGTIIIKPKQTFSRILMRFGPTNERTTRRFSSSVRPFLVLDGVRHSSCGRKVDIKQIKMQTSILRIAVST